MQKNRSTDCPEIFTTYAKHFGLVPDFFQKKCLLTIFCEKFFFQETKNVRDK